MPTRNGYDHAGSTTCPPIIRVSLPGSDASSADLLAPAMATTTNPALHRHHRMPLLRRRRLGSLVQRDPAESNCCRAPVKTEPLNNPTGHYPKYC
eukprot:scaffold23285_cov113-Isochrysis_galbana.AAC.3